MSHRKNVFKKRALMRKRQQRNWQSYVLAYPDEASKPLKKIVAEGVL